MVVAYIGGAGAGLGAGEGDLVLPVPGVRVPWDTGYTLLYQVYRDIFDMLMYHRK